MGSTDMSKPERQITHIHKPKLHAVLTAIASMSGRSSTDCNCRQFSTSHFGPNSCLMEQQEQKLLGREMLPNQNTLEIPFISLGFLLEIREFLECH